MALLWRFIAKSWLRHEAISVLSTARGGDSQSRPGPTTCWGKLPTIRANWLSGGRRPDAQKVSTGGQMTLIKSILLGSAAGIVAVAAAQAADLPTRKAAPVGICQDLQRRRHHRLDAAGLRHLREVLGLHHRSVHGRQSQHPVQLGSNTCDCVAAYNPALAATLPLFDAAAAATQRVLVAGQRRSAEHDLLSSRDRLVDPRQLRLRLRVQHRLRPVDRPPRTSTPKSATASTTPAATDLPQHRAT